MSNGTTRVDPSEVSLSEGARQLDVTFDPPADIDEGPWTVVLSTATTDPAGNPLRGGWTESAAAYQGYLGPADTAPAISSCHVDHTVFRPDGDEGVGTESDSVRLLWSAASMPTWWVVSARDRTTGEIQTLDVLTPASGAGSWDWSGRNERGQLLDPGVWQLTVQSESALGVRSSVCGVDVLLDLPEAP